MRNDIELKIGTCQMLIHHTHLMVTQQNFECLDTYIRQFIASETEDCLHLHNIIHLDNKLVK